MTDELPFPFVKPRRHPNSLVLTVKLHGAPCRRLRRAFFARMHQEARRLGIVLSHKRGVCVLFGAERICTTAHRHQMLNWLSDQPEVALVGIDPLGHLSDLFLPHSRLLRREGSRSADEVAAVRAVLVQVAGGAIKQWVRYVTGGLA